MLVLDRTDDVLFDTATGRLFDPARRLWSADGAPHGEAVSAIEAATWLQRTSGHRLRPPVGVIGPREATAEMLAAAEAVGRACGEIGLAVVCGGRQGVMEAVCRGVAAAGGVSIGLLPETDPAAANAYVSVPIATGIGEARNALVARAAFCLVAIGDGYGTLSEVALGLQFGRPVLGLCGAAQVPGVRHVADADAAVEALARIVLAMD